MDINIYDVVSRDLIHGIMHPFLTLVRDDQTLDLEFRKGGFDIFYRGEVLVQLRRGNTSDKYSAEFTSIINFKEKQTEEIINDDAAKAWCDLYTYPLKKYWDRKLGEHNKTEREYQQLIVRENNYSPISISTDYFITNMEDSNNDEVSQRFDLVGIKWESTSQARKGTKSDLYYPKLVVIEVKYGDKAIGSLNYDNKGKQADLFKHLDDVNKFFSNSDVLKKYKEETLNLFKAKRNAGLIPDITENHQKIDKLSDDLPEYIIAIINHDPDASALKEIISECNFLQYKTFAPYFAYASNLGYGLYAKRMLSPSDVLINLKKDFLC